MRPRFVAIVHDSNADSEPDEQDDPELFRLKVGRAVDVLRRVMEWTKQCRKEKRKKNVVTLDMVILKNCKLVRGPVSATKEKNFIVPLS